jgi:hypothetical protein
LACLADLRAEAAKLSEAADSKSLSRKGTLLLLVMLTL